MTTFFVSLNYRTVCILCAIAIALFAYTTTKAQQLSEPDQDVPRIVSYQGVLRNISDGEHRLIVTLYSDEVGSQKVWNDVYNTLIVNGVFSVALGGGSKQFPELSRLNRPLWVGVSVNGTPEMRPLTQIASVPYALNVPNKSITMEKLSDEVRQRLTHIHGEQDIQGVGENACPMDPNSAGGTDYVGGGCGNIAGTGNYAAILGGFHNHVSGSKSVLVGGDSNLVSGPGSGLLSGYKNIIAGQYSTLGGGYQNIISSTYFATLGGGNGNNVTAEYASLVGGSYNLSSGYGSFVGGGLYDTADGLYSVVNGGYDNKASNYAVVSGGINNEAYGYSAILGGSNLKLGGYSFGFNSSNKTNQLDITSESHIGFLNNLNLWLYNDDTSARELRFYEPWMQSDNGNYTAFKAQQQTANIVYTLPVAQGSANSYLKNDGSGGLTWTDPLEGKKAWYTTGNTSTTVGTHYLGTTDDEPFQIHVYNDDAANKGSKRVMRFEPNALSANIIGGYQGNTIGSGTVGSVISGGGANTMTNTIATGTDFSFIGGGTKNTISGDTSVIVGGSNNLASGTGSVVVGGVDNVASGLLSALVGGKGNTANGTEYSFIGGGVDNFILSAYGAISGGFNNRASNYAFTGSGSSNLAGGQHSVVGGGEFDTANGTHTTVGGGKENRASGQYSFVGGGRGNKAFNTSSTVAGGSQNFAGEEYTTIGGGSNNIIPNNSSGWFATIPGGHGLTAQSYAQLVGASHNIPQGIATFGNYRGQDAADTEINRIARTKDRLFILGNGYQHVGDTVTTNENAFEVANSGYSIVYRNLNNRGVDAPGFIDAANPSHHTNDWVDPAPPFDVWKPEPPIYGATYQDNQIIAWGDVPAKITPGDAPITSSFGVLKVMKSATLNNNEYVVELSNMPSDTDPNQLVGLNQASITATPSYPYNSEEPTACITLMVSPISGNKFKVWTYRSCSPSPEAFMFKIVGRR